MIVMKRKGDRKTDTAPALAPVPWSQMAKADRLSDLVDRALEQNQRILSSEFDPNDLDPANLKRMGLILTAAQMVFTLQAKVDDARLRATQSAVGAYDDMFRRLRDDEAASAKPIEEILREMAAKER
jgi:hypothetical protein